jgi:hypothetical protein
MTRRVIEFFYRSRLSPIQHMKHPDHADYQGTMQLANCWVGLRLWVHEDGSLGLRLGG